MYWDAEMERMHREMDRIFGIMVGEPEHSKRNVPVKSHVRSAVANCYETEGAVVSCFELPGVDKKDIELNVTDKYVEVKVEKKAEKHDNGHYFSTSSSLFYRRVALPADVEPDNAKATYKQGVLRVEIPKKKTGNKRKIQIE